ncbi:MAG: hypothetical protein GY708_00330 [Actinomycetia bacterium]|nr:hypothetical protein [Actinomycetes bacterium]MCP4961345.1 hypothetical protein [Actinomycetes bacterium]
MTRALKTEAVAILTTPVARLLLLGSVVMAVVSCAANLAVLDDLSGDEATRLALHAATVPAMLFAMIAGAYATSTDRRFGFIDQRLVTDPSRLRWLAAKSGAQASLGLVYGLLGSATAITVSTIVFAARGATFDLVSPTVGRAIVGVLVATPLLAIIGSALGSLTANTSAVVSGLLVWALVLEPPAVVGLPEIGRWLPLSAGLGLTYSPDEALLGQIMGGAVLLAYTFAAFAFATRNIERADI